MISFLNFGFLDYRVTAVISLHFYRGIKKCEPPQIYMEPLCDDSYWSVQEPRLETTKMARELLLTHWFIMFYWKSGSHLPSFRHNCTSFCLSFVYTSLVVAVYISHWLYAYPFTFKDSFCRIRWYCHLEIEVESRRSRLILRTEEEWIRVAGEVWVHTWLHSQCVHPSVPLYRHLVQLFWKNTKAFPGQARTIISPAWPGPSPS